jgi:hypothetical protein
MQSLSNNEDRLQRIDSERYEAIRMLYQCSPWNLFDVCKICLGYKKHNENCRYIKLTNKYY